MVNPRNARRYLILRELLRDFGRFALYFVVGTIALFLIWGLCEGIKDTCFPKWNHVPYVEGR